jgi:hypothetical protein
MVKILAVFSTRKKADIKALDNQIFVTENTVIDALLSIIKRARTFNFLGSILESTQFQLMNFKGLSGRHIIDTQGTYS